MKSDISGNGAGSVLNPSLGNLTRGEDGKSAYEIAVAHGFIGTEEEWLSYVSANGEEAKAAAEAAEASAATAKGHEDQAAYYASQASTHAARAEASSRSAESSRADARNAASSASASAAKASLHEESAAEAKNAAQASSESARGYMEAADERAAAAKASQIAAKVSEEICAECSVDAIDAARRAEAAAAAAGHATEEYYTKEDIDLMKANTDDAIADRYTKDEVNAKESAMQEQVDDRYTKAEVDGMVSAIPKFKVLVVGALPPVGEQATIYLVRSGTQSGNLYTEYIVSGTSGTSYEQLGEQRLDLSGYQTLEDAQPYKEKLDGIEEGAQKNTVTGVKGNEETLYRTGNVNITPASIGLGNVDNTHDHEKSVHYAALSGTSAYAVQAGNAATAVKAGTASRIDTMGEAISVGGVFFTSAATPNICLVCVQSGTSI